VGLQALNSPKWVISGINLPQRVYTLKRFFYKIYHEGESPRPAPSRQIAMMSFLKCRLTALKTAEIGVVGINFTKDGTTPLVIFYRIRLGEGTPRSTLSCQISPLSLKKCGLITPKIAKKGIF